jgi:serine/threonine-protein kinase HipA
VGTPGRVEDARGQALNRLLDVFAGEALMAHIGHDAEADTWTLAYAATWLKTPSAFPLSPALPLVPPDRGYDSRSVKRFIEHLLPEGHALDVAVASNGLARSNVFGLIRALGSETAGVLRFRDAQANTAMGELEHRMRHIPIAELDARIADRDVPFTIWDGRVRMSVAGVQDKLLVYLDAPLDRGGRLFLVDGPRLASTHILKPDLGQPRLPHLAVNEHFCMMLAQRIGLPAAQVDLLRTPRPVLIVQRFDRALQGQDDTLQVERLHIVDACQARDLPVSFKYERNLGNGPEVRHIRDGMSFERLFALADLAGNKAAARLAMLRWALFQFLIGNSDAHGKNFSFFVRPGGYLEPAPWYDLVSVVQYAHFDTDLAMAFGDAFTFDEVKAFALADFAVRCGVDRKLMRREAQRLAGAASRAAVELAHSNGYRDDEREFVARLATFVGNQAQRLTELAREAAEIPARLF